MKGKRNSLTWREHVRQCDRNDASKRRLEQMVQHGVLLAAGLAFVLWGIAQGIM